MPQIFLGNEIFRPIFAPCIEANRIIWNLQAAPFKDCQGQIDRPALLQRGKPYFISGSQVGLAISPRLGGGTKVAGIVRDILKSPVSECLDRSGKDHALLHSDQASVDGFGTDSRNAINFLDAVESSGSIHDDNAFRRFRRDHRRAVPRPNQSSVADENPIVFLLTHAIEVHDAGFNRGFREAVSLRIVEHALDVVAVDVSRFHRPRSRIVVRNAGRNVLAQIPNSTTRNFGHSVDLVHRLQRRSVKRKVARFPGLPILDHPRLDPAIVELAFGSGPCLGSQSLLQPLSGHEFVRLAPQHLAQC